MSSYCVVCSLCCCFGALVEIITLQRKIISEMPRGDVFRFNFAHIGSLHNEICTCVSRIVCVLHDESRIKAPAADYRQSSLALPLRQCLCSSAYIYYILTYTVKPEMQSHSIVNMVVVLDRYLSYV